MPDNFDPAALAAHYIELVEDSLSNKIKINAAVVERQILINRDPNSKLNKGNRASLDEVADQFDQNGNLKKNATVDYHQKPRVDNERETFKLTGLSEWEKIALAAAYFKAGSDLIMENGMKEMQAKLTGQTLSTTDEKLQGRIFTKCLSAIQLIVAAELHSVAGLKNQTGYELNEDTTAKLKTLAGEANSIGQRALETAKLMVLMEDKKEALYKHKLAIEQRNGGTPKVAAVIKSQSDQQKHAILTQGMAAIDAFIQNRDLGTLTKTVRELTEKESQRDLGRGSEHKVTQLIADLNKTVAALGGAVAPVATAKSSAVNTKSSFFKQSPASPTLGPDAPEVSISNKSSSSKR